MFSYLIKCDSNTYRNSNIQDVGQFSRDSCECVLFCVSVFVVWLNWFWYCKILAAIIWSHLFFYQCSYIRCLVTPAASRSGCCTAAVRTGYWMRWRETTSWRSPKRSSCKIRSSFIALTGSALQSVDMMSCAQMEIDCGDGLTEEFLYEEVHPMEHTLKQAFSKPRGPGGKRGNKRIIKGAGGNGEES